MKTFVWTTSVVLGLVLASCGNNDVKHKDKPGDKDDNGWENLPGDLPYEYKMYDREGGDEDNETGVTKVKVVHENNGVYALEGTKVYYDRYAVGGILYGEGVALYSAYGNAYAFERYSGSMWGDKEVATSPYSGDVVLRGVYSETNTETNLATAGDATVHISGANETMEVKGPSVLEGEIFVWNGSNYYSPIDDPTSDYATTAYGRVSTDGEFARVDYHSDRGEGETYGEVTAVK